MSILFHLVGLTAACFGLGATLSNFLGQLAVEKLGHVEALAGSMIISFIPIVLFGWFMPETIGQRGRLMPSQARDLCDGHARPGHHPYSEMM
jgi:hypothetical protein